MTARHDNVRGLVAVCSPLKVPNSRKWTETQSSTHASFEATRVGSSFVEVMTMYFPFFIDKSKAQIIRPCDDLRVFANFVKRRLRLVSSPPEAGFLYTAALISELDEGRCPKKPLRSASLYVPSAAGLSPWRTPAHLRTVPLTVCSQRYVVTAALIPRILLTRKLVGIHVRSL